MPERGEKEFLCDIREAIDRIDEYIGEMDYDEFLKDRKTQDAVVRNLEIIGEAVKNLSKDIKDKHKDISWKDIAGMRDRIIHFYFGIKWDIVWSVVKDKLPVLKEQISKILKHIEDG